MGKKEEPLSGSNIIEVFELLIGEIQNHGNLDEQEIERIRDALNYKTIGKSDYLFKGGSQCDFIYFMISGCVQLYELDVNENKRVKQFAFDGWWITDFTSFHDRTWTNLQIQGIENCSYFTLHYDDYCSLINTIPAFSNYFRWIYQQFFSLCQDLFFAVTQNDSKGAYLFITEKYPLLLQRIPLYLLASFLGITPVLISNIRRQIFKD